MGLHHALSADGFAALTARQPRFGLGMPVTILHRLLIQFFMLWLIHAHAKFSDILDVSRSNSSRLAATKSFSGVRLNGGSLSASGEPFGRLSTGLSNPTVTQLLGFGLHLRSLFRTPIPNPVGAVVDVTVPE